MERLEKAHASPVMVHLVSLTFRYRLTTVNNTFCARVAAPDPVT